MIERRLAIMKSTKLALITAVVCSLTLFSGCAKKLDSVMAEEETVKIDTVEETNPVEKKINLTIWSWFGFGDLLSNFEAENPNITVTQKLFNFSQCDEEYMKALANGTGPDILVFDSSFFGQYTVDNILVNLLEEPYSAHKYKNDFIGWESGLSLNNKELLSLTYSTAPFVTLYRADIMKENGFPHEPEEFGKYIENPDNLIKIGKKLKEQNKFIFQYPTDITDIAGATIGYFDQNLNYIRNGDLLAKSMNLAQQIYDNNLISHKNFWQEAGKTSIQESTLVMFPLASYTMGTLKNYAPDQGGKWRVTKAPLGLTAWASDSRLSMNIQSKNKKEAWMLMEYILTKTSNMDYVVPGYIPTLNNPESTGTKDPYYGDQNVYLIIKDLATNMSQYNLTPLDRKAHSIYIKGMWESLITPEDVYKDMEKLSNNINKELANEKQALLE